MPLALAQVIEEVVGQVVLGDLGFAFGHQPRGAQQVAQLADIARPVVAAEHLHHRLADAGRLAGLHARLVLAQQPGGHHVEVAALAQAGSRTTSPLRR